MSVADRLNKLSTDITNAYTSINNKGGTIPANKNTNNLPTAIDSIQSSNIIGATAEGESLSLTNTKAMPYSDYLVEGKSEQEGEPSPSYPSEIHSVADDVNLFDVGTISDYRNFYNDGDVANWFSINSNILNVIIQDSGATMFYNKKQYKGNENYTIKLKSSMVGNRIYIKLRNANNTDWLTNSDVTISNMTYNSYYKGWFYQSTILNTTLTISVPNCLYCCIGFGFASDNIGTTQTIENIKLQKGTVATPYSPYNQGTVTIKQRGKNLFDGEIELGNINPDNGSLSNSTTRTRSKNFIKVEPNTTYSYYHTSGENRWIVGYTENKIGISDGIQSHPSALKEQFLSAGNTFQFTTSPTTEYIKWYDTNCTDLTERVQLEQGSQATSYEPYQANDYTIQTEPLRSLPNGVKDTIEADGIHRRVGRIVLDGSESGWYKQDNTSYSEDYLRFTIGITDKKNASNPNSKKDNILSNNFTNKILDNNSTRKTNSITGQYSTNLINIFVAQNIINGSKVEDFKTWLSNNPTEVLYELAEEIIEPLTQKQATTMLDIIKTGSYEGTTNIYTDEDVKPTMKVGYYKKV